MSTLPVTNRYPKALGPTPPPSAPEWVQQIDNPYLHGFFAPLDKEWETAELEAPSDLPKDIQGTYFRNGSNPKNMPINRYHWFDGDGMIQSIRFAEGKIFFSSRWIRTAGFKMEKEKGESIWPGVLGPFDLSAPLFPIKDTANTDLVYFDKKLLALWYESGQAYQVDPVTLETLGVARMQPPMPQTVSAHSKVDPHTGELIFFSYADKPPYMQYGVVSPGGKVHCTDIELPGPRRPHDIGVTPNYSILHDFPLFHDPELFKKTGKRIPLFHPDVPTRYGILPRYGDNKDVKWFEAEPCYMLHVVNSWEDGDWVTMIGCRTKDPSLKPHKEDGKIAAMLSGLKLQANLYSWRFNLKTGEVEEKDLDDLNAEFPMINPRFFGKSNRYAYLQHIPFEIPATFEALIKYDLQDGSYTRFDYGKGVFASEAPYVDRSSGSAEDDGYVITFVTDTNNWTSSCWIFSAADITLGPICKIPLPQRLTAGFHTTWVPAQT